MALSATLIVSAVLLLIISQSVLRSSTSTQTLIEVQQSMELQSRAHACLENVYQKYMTNVSYIGNEELYVQGGVCTILPIESDDTHATLFKVETNENDMYFSMSLQVDVEETELATSRWLVQ